MMEVISRGTSNVGSRDARGLFGRLLSGRQMKMLAAGLLLAGGLSLANGSYAQAQSSGAAAQSGDCTEKCAKAKEQCYQDGSTDEYCTYELNVCKKACGK